MIPVKIKVKSEISDIFQISIDDYVVLKVNHAYENTLSVNLETGKKHTLVFYAEGAEGERYLIEVLSPVHLDPLEQALDADGKDYGYITLDLRNPMINPQNPNL